MKHALIAGALSALIAAPAFAAQETYLPDPSHTYANFSVNHMGLSTVHGRFNKSDGKILLDRDAKTGSIDIAIDTKSIDTGWAKRDEHMRGGDFFSAEKFPTMNYKSTKLTFNGDKLVKVDGELTLLGVTKPLSLDVTSFTCTSHPMTKTPVCAADATATLNRSDFGMKAYVPAISDQVVINIGIEAFKQ
ncbi:YceI family protein [Chitinivorax sp. PXF-14]|uniref:YceI family protein n=1 Tax=Chitinivorax sp. PXF-14 TaxID=3230488 RepID=UPI0034659AFB